MKWRILNLSPVAWKVWWEQVKRVSLSITPCSSRARYEESWERIKFLPIFTLRNLRAISPRSTGVGWGKRGMRENALRSLLAKATLCPIVLFEHAVSVSFDQSILLFFCFCYPWSILTSFTCTCLLSTRLRHLTAFDDVVFAFNLMFHSEHLSPLMLVAGTLCCVRNQNSAKQIEIIFCKILKKTETLFYKVYMTINSLGVITESCLSNFPRVFELF